MRDTNTPNQTHDKWLNCSAINREFRAIATANAWQAYHTPKNLAAAISVEAGELLAEFQWLTPEESLNLSIQQAAQVANEVSDIVMYLTELCERLNIDIAAAIAHKVQTNKQRFIVQDITI